MTTAPPPTARPDREQLILEHYPLVRAIASRMIRRFPHNVELRELISVGTLGLIDAVDRYDPNRSVPFKAYAEIRIRGAIVDALRDADWIPRTVRRKIARIDTARRALHQKLGREPERAEIAEKLGISVEEYDDWIRRAPLLTLISADMTMDDDSDGPLVDKLPALGNTALESKVHEETKAQVLKALHRLPEREQLVLRAYYIEELNLKQIGVQLGVTESRVCQIRLQALSHLRQRMDEEEIASFKNPPPELQVVEARSTKPEKPRSRG